MKRAAWCVAVVLALAARAGADEPRAVIEKAVKAHGGADKIGQLKAVQIRTKGTLESANGSVPFTAETFAQMPGQIKNVLQVEVNGEKRTLTQVLNGDKVALLLNGQAQPVRDAVAGELKELLYAERVNHLLPLLDDKTIELTAAGEGKVGDMETTAVKVTSKGHKDVVLHFDKNSGLLVKAERTVLDLETAKEVPQVEVYGGYKEVNGLMRPMKVTVSKDGKQFMEGEVTDVKYSDKLDDSVFQP
jgi:hypothetical protein